MGFPTTFLAEHIPLPIYSPKTYTYLVLRQKAPAFSGANATQALFDIEETIPKGDPYAPLPPTGFYGESRGFSFVVKQRGDNNLLVYNAAEALRQTRANLRQTIPENNTVVSDKVMVMDGNYNEAITGFYPTDWLELMQGCPH